MLRLLFVILLFSISTSSLARQSCDWPFSTSITVTETSGQTTSNYSVKLTLTGGNSGTLHSGYNWSSDGADLRIYNSVGSTPLAFSIESWSQSNQTAEVWVTFPTFNARSSNTIEVYYGNNAVATAAGTPPSITYVDGKIKFHTRYNNKNTSDPTSLSHAKALFDSQDDSISGYSCSHPAQYQNITNVGQGGVNHDFIAYSEAYFTVPTSGQWGVRYGADYGLGGGLYVNGIALDERWDEDLWWGGSDWNNSDVLQGVTSLTAGEHKLEIIGAEGGNDGGLTIQFYNGSTNTWGLASNSNVNISIRSQACPAIRHTIQYGNHDVCGVDLSISSSVQSNEWFVNSENNFTIQVDNQSSTPSGLSAPADTAVSIQLPTEVTLIDSFYSGLNWTCTGTSGVISCLYNQAITTSGSSSTLTLHTEVAGTADANVTISAQVTGYLPDTQSTNNTTSQTMILLSNVGLPADCSSPKPGVWARFFDTANAGIVINDASEYQALIDAQMKPEFLYGQTIVSNINGSGNPFDNNSNPDHFLVVFQGYLNITQRGDYYFGVDGDDAVEAWVNDSIISSYYGAHGTSGGANNKVKIKLSTGFHKIEFRLQENEGGDAYDFYWSRKKNGGDSIIPASTYYHCAGNPDIQLNTGITVINDGINGSNPKAIPGSELNMLVTASNAGNISTDLNSTTLIQAIDADTKFYIGDFNGLGPIDFTDGNDASGLSYTYSDLSNTSDSLSFSINGTTFDHTPVNDGEDYDPTITHIKLEFNGTMKSAMNGITPSFSFEYQVKLE